MDDQMHDAYEDLAAMSGWAACAGCGEWVDRRELERLEGYVYLYCHTCALALTGDDEEA